MGVTPSSLLTPTGQIGCLHRHRPFQSRHLPAHQRYDSYTEAARSLWTTFIPTTPPLTNAQIYAVMAMHEARMVAEA